MVGGMGIGLGGSGGRGSTKECRESVGSENGTTVAHRKSCVRQSVVNSAEPSNPHTPMRQNNHIPTSFFQDYTTLYVGIWKSRCICALFFA